LRYFVLFTTVIALCLSTVDLQAQNKIRNAKMAVTSAKIYINHEKWDDALDVINQGIALDSTNAELYMMLGDVQGELAHYAQTDTALKKAFALDVKLGKDIEKIRNRFFRPLMRDGLSALNDEKPDSAEVCFKNVIALCPEKVDGYINLGIICYDRSDYDCAICNFRKAWKIERENSVALKNLALSFSLSDQPDSALAVYRMLLAANPGDFDTRNKMATLFLNTGKYDMASAIYDSIITDDMDDAANTLYNAGVAYAQTKQYEKARKVLEGVLAINDNDTDAMVNTRPGETDRQGTG